MILLTLSGSVSVEPFTCAILADIENQLIFTQKKVEVWHTLMLTSFGFTETLLPAHQPKVSYLVLWMLYLLHKY
jgi:hypothetical protein